MKRILLAGCAILGLGSSGALAQEIWGDASVALEYYSEPDFDYDETDIEGAARVLMRFDNGFNIQGMAFVGHDLDHDVTFGNVNTDLFYATPTWAAGVYAGVFGNTNDYTNVFAGAQAVRFFTMVDVGGWVGWESNDGNDNAEAGAWLTAYVTPNDAIGASLFWAGNDNFDSYGIGWYAEHRFNDTQWSIWTDGAFRQNDSFGVDFESWNTRIGVTYFFDPRGTTLQAHTHAMPF